MKKMNVMMTAAVAGLFAVTAHAGDKKAHPKTEKDCTEAKMTWKDGKCSCAAKEAAPATTTTPAPAAK